MRSIRSPSGRTAGGARGGWSRWVGPDVRAILLMPLLALALLMLVACGRDEPRPQVVAPAPEVGARGNPGQDIDGLRRNIPITAEVTPLPMAQVENFDVRRGRAYPMQPPTIPHSIDGYQV